GGGGLSRESSIRGTSGQSTDAIDQARIHAINTTVAPIPTAAPAMEPNLLRRHPTIQLLPHHVEKPLPYPRRMISRAKRLPGPAHGGAHRLEGISDELGVPEVYGLRGTSRQVLDVADDAAGGGVEEAADDEGDKHTAP